MTVVANRVQMSDVKRATQLMEAYADVKKREAEGKAEKKAIEEELLRLAEKNMADWFAGGKTYNLPNGQLKFTAESTLVFDEEIFQFKVFSRHFPHLITIDPKKVITIGKVRTYLNAPTNTKAQQEALAGLKIDTVDKFEVKPL